VSPIAPRFEDAFVALLGGQPKRTLSLETKERARRTATEVHWPSNLFSRLGSRVKGLESLRE
jgi:hypothetical protein